MNLPITYHELSSDKPNLANLWFIISRYFDNKLGERFEYLLVVCVLFLRRRILDW